ncbi:alkanesulfonate monooxygenase SsuD/methylene tetrahydromethanopterin reductase-like flavin-dependent oxidoreductase (luciferase family) [Actinoplanes lutulentus]|uniref:Alkanesulfonate monooxygenase SsuD/methylene tetrahydromethanopterin reductase-like flavin-dependent oxidoreductase (Luciferase family) n=1 Tax=Actinoplanes lutulentus TaxID=1287878 RepID=A0A327ZDB9_9ACTN|nr:LLM class flavin-dependent oxidoreductase [Actinoplanes lutulentus]MBB2942697.1 alkanesulfonate monooxygenase SsuD/methylene tetrahydromethanopterin reductase-like flavin-dependent oxidoreductase (luciferase family) [Actinoplanes lutulentus]RAK38278.1 alkanesulfonate monooxygenase SsuD/methylene tetrahydromethanopterin reductase-like flavin-dependent oxidoreductase (luciferase family) [Actinoplanes lutulentus]
MSRQLHLGVFFTGVGPQLIWTDPAFAAHTHIDTFVRTAQTLERGLFDAFFLGEGLRVRENRGRIHELDVAGRPDAITQLAALAAVTEKIGLVATQNTTYNYPADLARRLASLDVVSGGRAGWNIVTTDNAWTGENFRHGGWLPHERRYERAEAFVATARELWAGQSVDRHTDLIDVTATPTVTGRPVLFQAGDSPGGRELAAKHADVVFSANTDFDKAVAYAADLRERLAKHGRSADSLRILPGAQVIIGDTPAEAAEKAEWLKREQVNGPRAIAFLEQYWGKDLSGYDPDGPLPDVEPAEGELDPSRGTIAIEHRTGKRERIAEWRSWGLSIRELVLRVTPRHNAFIGTPGQIADEWTRYLEAGAVDGFNVVPQQLPGTIDDLVDKLVPALQERGVYRTAYSGSTLREHLDLR